MKAAMGSELRNRLNQEFIRESDRGCAVLTACLIEESLLNVFSKVLQDGEQASQQFMPRGRLAQGISNAAALGLIREPLVGNLKLIIKVRNIFAHRLLDGLTFESPDIRNLVMKLELPNLDHATEATRKRINEVSRERYMEVFGFAIASLERISMIAKKYPVYEELPSALIEI